jgi:hypothetical protein
MFFLASTSCEKFHEIFATTCLAGGFYFSQGVRRATARPHEAASITRE